MLERLAFILIGGFLTGCFVWSVWATYTLMGDV